MNRLVLILLLFAATLCAQTPPLMLGVVEDVMGPLEQDPHTRGVRAVFYKGGEEWKAFSPECMTQECLQKFVPEFPKEQSWTIAFDGKNIGRITTRTALKKPDLVRFSHLQIITQPVPAIGSATEEFAGFLGTAVLRPLVAVSQPNFKDPDLWKPTVLEPAKAALVRQEFVKKIRRSPIAKSKRSTRPKRRTLKLRSRMGRRAGGAWCQPR